MAFKVVVNGTDRTGFVTRRVTPKFSAKQNERSTATLEFAPGFVPNQYDPIQIYDVDGTTVVFGGVVTQCQTSGIEPGSTKHFTVATCIDSMFFADLCYWTKTYTTTVTVHQVLTDLITDKLGAYGITLDAGQDTGDTLQPFTVTQQKVSDFLRTLGTSCSPTRVIRMSPLSAIRCLVPGTLSAPVAISDASPHCQSFEWGHTTFIPANYVTLICGPTGPGTPTNLVTVATSPVTWQVDIQAVLGGWNAGVVVENPAGSPITRTLSPPGFGGYYYFDPTVGRGTLSIGTGVRPSNGTVLAFTYTAIYPFSVVATTGATPKVEGQDIDPNQLLLAPAQLEVNGILAQLNQSGLRNATIVTWLTGFSPSQSASVTLTNREFVSTTISIIQVDAEFTEYADAMGFWAGAGVRLWRYTLTATETLAYQGSYLDQFRAMIGNSSGSSTIVSGGGGGGGGGTVGGSGTVGKLPKWASTSNLTDSIVTDSGSGISVAGTLAATTVTVNNTITTPASTSLKLNPTTGNIGFATGSPNIAGFASGSTVFTAIGTATGQSAQIELASFNSITSSLTALSSVNFYNATNRTARIVGITNGTGGVAGGLDFYTTDGSSSQNLCLRVLSNSSTDFYLLPGAGDNQGNIGGLLQKWLTVNAAELHVEALVAQDTIVTIGGRALIASGANILTTASGTGTSLNFKYNDMTVGDIIVFEGPDTGGSYSIEFMQVTGGPVGTGPYGYTVTRNLDGSGTNTWASGASCMNTGQTGAGFIDIYALNSLKSTIEAGPTIVGNVRNSSTYNDWSPRWAIGNLKNITAYGYGSTTNAVALGDGTKAWMSLDDTNGLRIMYGGAVHAQIDTSGNAMFASGNCTIDQNGVRITTTGTASTLHGYNFTTTFTGTNLAGMYVIESGTTRQVVIQNSTTMAAQRVWSILEAAGNSTLAYLQVANDETGGGAGPQVIVNSTFLPAANNAVSCGTSSFQWSDVRTVALNVSGPGAFQSTIAAFALGSGTGTTLILDGSSVIRLNSSSERFKTNIRRHWKPTASLLTVDPIRFDYRDGTTNVIGFSAEDLWDAGLTELVNLDADGLPFSIREHALIAHLAAIVKQQDARIIALEAKSVV